MEKILLTGAEGMIGSHLLNYLTDNGYYVTQFVGDVTIEEDWNKYYDRHFDGMIHLAALAGVRPSFQDPEKYYFNNVEGTERAFDFARANNISKVLYASSSNAYEWWGNPYAATKKMNEIQGQHLPSIGMRFHTVWPGREDMLYRKLQKGEVSYINVNHHRDFIHVDDLVSAIRLIYDNFSQLLATGRVRDIGTGQTVSVADVAKVMGYQGEYRTENPVGERIETCANVEYLLQLGWTPTKNILNQ
jgi:nucleoside-diphosphate-sugar epimerase